MSFRIAFLAMFSIPSTQTRLLKPIEAMTFCAGLIDVAKNVPNTKNSL